MTNRRGCPLTSQAIGVLLRNQLYAGMVDVPEYGVRGKRSDVGPLVSDEIFDKVLPFCRAEYPVIAPLQRSRPACPAQGFVQLASGDLT